MTNSAASVTRNAAVLTALRLVVPALGMIVVLAVSRAYGSEGLGRYTLAITYLGFMTTVTPLGLNAFLMREGARDLAGLPRMFANAVTLTTVVAVASMPVQLLLGRLLGYDAATQRVLLVMSLGILPATLLSLCDGVFVSRQRSSFIGLYTAVDVLIRVGVATWLISRGYSVMAVVAALVGAQIMALVVAAWLSHRLGSPLRLAFDRATMRRLLSSAPTFVSISVFATLYWRIDVVMLSTLGSLSDVGLYGAAYRIMDLVRLLPQSLCMAVYPLVSLAAATDQPRLRRLGSQTLRFLWMATLPMAVGGTILAGPILAFTVGEEFRAAGMTLAVLLWTAIPYTLVRYYSYVIVAANRERVDLLLNVALSGVNIVLNFVLIPSYGALGSAFATLISICLYALAQYLYLLKYLPGHLAPLPPMSGLLGAATVMGLFVWIRRADQVVMLIAAAAIVYIVALLLTRSASIRELLLLRQGDVNTGLDGNRSGTPIGVADARTVRLAAD